MFTNLVRESVSKTLDVVRDASMKIHCHLSQLQIVLFRWGYWLQERAVGIGSCQNVSGGVQAIGVPVT